jgi:hypothetical protein
VVVAVEVGVVAVVVTVDVTVEGPVVTVVVLFPSVNAYIPENIQYAYEVVVVVVETVVVGTGETDFVPHEV